jgi:hypothetical protein
MGSEQHIEIIMYFGSWLVKSHKLGYDICIDVRLLKTVLTLKLQYHKVGFMKRFITNSVIFTTVFILVSCWGPKMSVEEENVLASLSNIQRSLENDISYEQFIELLNQAKIEIDSLKGSSKNSACFMGAVDKCYAFYTTGGRAWKQKLTTTDQGRKQDMDLTLSVLQSRAALSIQMADKCYKN